MVKALSMWQLWASLVALGVKTIETRSWRAPKTAIGQPLLIHAAKRLPRNGTRVGDWQVYGTCDGSEPDIWCLGQDNGPTVPLPQGAVVASCTLTDCVPMVDEHRSEYPYLHVRDALLVMGPTVGADTLRQEPYGDFRPGRWAWLLDDIKPTAERCPACWDRPPTASPGRCVDIDGGWWHTPGSCPHCVDACPVCVGGTRRVEPIPWRGRQGVFNIDFSARG